MSEGQFSIVDYFADPSKHGCGYCKSPDSNFSHGMWARTLTVQEYQALIDRGWRRSGKYCYKPIMDQTCCPMYTIKCEALQFKISKSQKKIIKRIAKFLRNELKNDEMEIGQEDHANDLDISIGEISNYKQHLERSKISSAKMHIASVDSTMDRRLPINTSVPNEAQEKVNSEQINLGTSTSILKEDATPSNLEAKNAKTISADPNKSPCKKAKLLRIERKQNKLLAQGKSPSEIETIMKKNKQQNMSKGLEELFEEIYGGTQKLQLKLVRTSPMSSGYINTLKESYEVYRKYQSMIHRVPAERITEQQYVRFLVESPLQMKLVRVRSEEFRRTFDASAKLYKKYQMAIHGDAPEECDEQTFHQFLVRSPLQPWVPENGPPLGYGSFHEQYWLDNKLIAVAVIDILPSCVSSVYFFYDPAYSHLSLGTFSSLREVLLARQLNRVASNLKYYYMGFYIHTCPKMRYKSKMKPSKLLCPETYVWCDIEPALVKLDKEKYSRLNDDIDAVDEDAFIDIDKVTVLHEGIVMPYKYFKKRARRVITQEDDDHIAVYAKLVGMKCAQSLVIYWN